MSFLNLQFEVSRIQYTLQEYLGIDKVKKCLQQNHKLETVLNKIGLKEFPQIKNSFNQIQPEESQIDNLRQIQQSQSELIMPIDIFYE